VDFDIQPYLSHVVQHFFIWGDEFVRFIYRCRAHFGFFAWRPAERLASRQDAGTPDRFS
jgi:hypothetical protein